MQRERKPPNGYLWGPRVTGRSPEDVIERAEITMKRLEHWQEPKWASISELRNSFADPAHAYYCLAALSRRSVLDPNHRASAEALLFRFRVNLESAMLLAIQRSELRSQILAAACARSFFGVSSKQGVSVRYPLMSCVPTQRCGAGCYAHDGRDRDLVQIFRGVMNYFVGQTFEEEADQRKDILQMMSGPVASAATASAAEAASAAREGFSRSPRIRFSHVGEMASTPAFTNALAQLLIDALPGIQCVVYTRHPAATKLDARLLTVNFTIESQFDSRLRFVPPEARLVSSAWNGEVVAIAEINFLEHHVEKISLATSVAKICPVTIDHQTYPSCDSAHCVKCFVRPLKC